MMASIVVSTALSVLATMVADVAQPDPSTLFFVGPRPGGNAPHRPTRSMSNVAIVFVTFTAVAFVVLPIAVAFGYCRSQRQSRDAARAAQGNSPSSSGSPSSNRRRNNDLEANAVVEQHLEGQRCRLRAEGLNELGEAPPAYKKKDEDQDPLSSMWPIPYVAPTALRGSDNTSAPAGNNHPRGSDIELQALLCRASVSSDPTPSLPEYVTFDPSPPTTPASSLRGRGRSKSQPELTPATTTTTPPASPTPPAKPLLTVGRPHTPIRTYPPPRTPPPSPASDFDPDPDLDWDLDLELPGDRPVPEPLTLTPTPPQTPTTCPGTGTCPFH